MHADMPHPAINSRWPAGRGGQLNDRSTLSPAGDAIETIASW